MLKIIGYLFLIGFGIALAKLFLSFIIAVFKYTIVTFMSVGGLSLILCIIKIIEPGTGWIIVMFATGIGLLGDIMSFIKDPSQIISDTKDNFNSPWDSGRASSSNTSTNEANDRYISDCYRKCCGSCRWLSGHSSDYNICTLNSREVSHSDCCGDWQSE